MSELGLMNVGPEFVSAETETKHQALQRARELRERGFRVRVTDPYGKLVTEDGD